MDIVNIFEIIFELIFMLIDKSLFRIEALREAAKKISTGKGYQWGHMGACNCGHLAQEICNMTSADIHSAAMKRHGDWRDQLRDYCPGSGLAIDDIILYMEEAGFSIQDLINLERLEDSKVRRFMGRTELRHNNPQDVKDYLNAWADMLEAEYLENVKLPQFTQVFQTA